MNRDEFLGDSIVRENGAAGRASDCAASRAQPPGALCGAFLSCVTGDTCHRADLTRHNCIGIRQGDEAYGVWRLTSGRGAARNTEAVRIKGNLTSNDGEIAVKWALDGHGILMRAEWDFKPYLADGSLVLVLPDHETPNANVFAVYSQRHPMSDRIRAFVDFIVLDLGSGAGKWRIQPVDATVW